MEAGISRRAFIQLCGLSLAGLAFRPPEDIPTLGAPGPYSRVYPLGRVTKYKVGVFAEPDEYSSRLARVERDTLISLYQEIPSPGMAGPEPHWYQVPGGFIQSAYIQKIQGAHLNAPLSEVPMSGRLGEVTVPYIQTLYKTRHGTWMPLYRLYFGSIHWITGLSEEMEGGTWYRLTDERLRIHYYAPAWAVRPIQPSELTPLSPYFPDCLKRIEISLSMQRLFAYEGGQAVFEAPISSGKRYMETPAGLFQVERKYPSRHMGDGGITSDLHAYELVGVPWVTFFHPAGIALHGTFWHDNFGSPMSQGCVNLRNEDAKWIFRWCGPYFNPVVADREGWKLVEKGTQVAVR
jgi:hypothetical protein